MTHTGEPHLAYQLRRLADTIASSSTRNGTQRQAETILAAGIHLWTQGHTALTKSFDWEGPWPTGGGTPGGKGDHSDPTATTALTPPDGHPERHYHRRLGLATASAVDAATAITHLIRAIHQTATPERPTGECAEHHCHDTAIRPRHGRCDPCAKWRERWTAAHPDATNVDIPPVPADVIDQRQIRRRRTRVA